MKIKFTALDAITLRPENELEELVLRGFEVGTRLRVVSTGCLSTGCDLALQSITIQKEKATNG